MDKSDILWLAGYLEGEGCFRIGASGNRPNAIGTPSVKVATDLDVAERVANLIGARVGVYILRPPRKQAYRAECFGAKAIAVMEAILPYMGERRSAKICEVIAIANGRPCRPRGEMKSNSKLTNAKAVEIREMIKDGVTQSKIARRFGVSQSLISLVKVGRGWSCDERGSPGSPS
jgi:hypothetical protein